MIFGKSSQQKKPREPWFAVRRDLGARRASLLTLVSFLLPLGIWCLVSYCPFIWHPDVRLEIAANRTDVNTVFTPGDHVGKDYFSEFQEGIRRQNDQTRQLIQSGGEWEGTESGRRRANKKYLRQIAPIAIANGWLSGDQAEDDAAIYEIWRDLATGEKVATDPPITKENVSIAQENWAVMSAKSLTYDSDNFPDQPLVQMIPQGRPSNPDYLPEPHAVLLNGWKEFARPVDDGQPTMADRLWHSMTIVFGGFLISCLIGIPIGVLCGTYQFFSRIFEPFIDFFRYMPAPTFSTLLVALFLANDAPKIALVVIGTVFQMVLVLSKTTKLIDVSLLEAAQTLGANQRQLLTKVVIPGIMPNVYNDLRILLGWAWTWLVIAELIGVKSGLTEFIETQGRWRNFDRVYPIIILIGLVGFFTDQILAWLSHIFFPWAHGDKGGKSRAVANAVLWFPRFLMNAARERVTDNPEPRPVTSASTARPGDSSPPPKHVSS